MNLTYSKRVSQTIAAGALALVAIGNAPSAQAAAFVDAAVREANGPVRVIVMMKDQLRAPRTTRSASTYLEVRRALVANAKESQRDVLGVIKRRFGFSAKAQSLWIVNAVVATIPSDQVKVLANHPDVRSILANREVRIIPGVRARTIESFEDKYTYGLNIIGIPQLRKEKSKSTGAGVTVATIDTGIDPAHPDLKGKVAGFADFVNGKKDAYDDHGHGTHVAGTIAGGNASGTAIGIAPEAKIVSAKAFSAGGSGNTESILKAMQFVADPDGKPETHDEPAIVSNSWGSSAPSPSSDPKDNAFCEAAGSWLKLGIFPAFSAGNSGPRSGTVGTPGACPQTYAVGATDDKDAVASFSSRGPTVWKTGTLAKPNISAPGVAVLSSMPGGKYGTMSGTSMACPHVAGLLALIYQVNPKISVDDAAKLVSKTSKDLGPTGHDPEFGAGRIDALTAVKGALRVRARAAR